MIEINGGGYDHLLMVWYGEPYGEPLWPSMSYFMISPVFIDAGQINQKLDDYQHQIASAIRNLKETP